MLLDAVPAGAAYALDVGCGEGVLARQLRERVPNVTGIDLHEPSIAAARAAGGDIAYVRDDVMTHPFAAGSFDVVTAVATLHHLGVERGLTRLASLVAPGGVLGIVGLGQPVYPNDLPVDLAGAVATRILGMRFSRYEHASPVADPAETHHQVRAIARRVLPGAVFRRHMLWRHTIVWRRPAS